MPGLHRLSEPQRCRTAYEQTGDESLTSSVSAFVPSAPDPPAFVIASLEQKRSRYVFAPHEGNTPLEVRIGETMGTILLVILVLLLIGALPNWGHSRNWGYGPSGGLGLVVVILIILLLMGRI
jgi:Protein of unknown function (DUF3309)